MIAPNYQHNRGDWAPQILALARIMFGLLFLTHAFVKLAGFPAGASPGLQAPFSFFWFAGVIELVFGLLVVFGLFTRPAGFLLSGQMAIGYFTVHAPRGFFPVLNGGEMAILYCFFFLYLAAAGAGAWSIDAARLHTTHSRHSEKSTSRP